MKRLINIPAAIIIVLGVLSVGAHAQSSSGPRVIASIPFTFNVGKTTLPAGRYAVTVLNPTSDRKILQIRNLNGRASAVTLTTGVIGNVTDDAKLVFERYGDRYFFKQAQLAGDPTSLTAVRSRTIDRVLVTAGKKQLIVIVAG